MRRIARKPSYRRRYTGTKAAVHAAKSTKSSAWRLKLRRLVYGAYRQVNYQAASLQIKLQRLLRHKHFRRYAVGDMAQMTGFDDGDEEAVINLTVKCRIE